MTSNNVENRSVLMQNDFLLQFVKNVGQRLQYNGTESNKACFQDF
jgi:hypothetical protein